MTKEQKYMNGRIKKGTRFRVVIDKISKRYLENLEKNIKREDYNCH